MDKQRNVLKSELAGIWYTEDPIRLACEIDVYLDASEQTVDEQIIALLLPHAGYRYSGMVAAQGVRQIAGRTFSRVILLGPSHRVAMQDAVSIPDVAAIETPLGPVQLDRELVERLWRYKYFQSQPVAHASEHSVQIELPFLQRALGDVRIVPIVCGELSEASARQIASTLLENIDADTLLLVSSDFTHYGYGFDYVPFTDEIQANLKTLDLNAFQQIEEKNLSGFLQYVQETGATICGRSPIAVMLAMLPESARVRLLRYETSGNLTGDWAHCVSYISAAITGGWIKREGDAGAAEAAGGLSDADKASLLRLARHAITRRLRADEPDFRLDPTPPMQETMGAFVTLHKQGQLRGCIGEIIPRRALYEAVAEQAENAAFNDPRFMALQEDELGEIDLEISALTPPRPVKSYDDIRIGRHGIVLRKNGYSAVFLPQVAPEQGWGLVETLTHLSMKAGLAGDAWREGCEFHVFEAVVFGEKDQAV